MEKNYSRKYWYQNKCPNKKEIHKQRCDNDPIYKLLFDNKDKEDFVEKLVQVSIKSIEKKYGKKLSEDKTISYMFSLLDTQKNDKLIRRIMMIFFIYWESSIYETIKNMYDKEGLFEDRGQDHFLMFYNKMGEFVEQTIRFPCNEQNIIEMLENFEKGAKMEYLMGPF